MATVTGLTADRMLAIEAASVVDGDVVGDNLILIKHDGSQINAGSVRGPVGPQGPVGSDLSVLAGVPVLDVGLVGQIRAGRQLSAADFTDLGLNVPLGLWNLGNLNDASGNGRNLLNKNGVGFASGINGVAASSAIFNGSTNQVLYIPDGGAADPFRIKTGSFGCWMRSAKRGSVQRLISKFTAAAPIASFLIDLYVDGTTGQCGVQVYGSSNVHTALGTTDCLDDRWHFVVGTHDGAAIRLYVDGMLEATTLVGIPINASIFGPLNIGGYGGDASTNPAAQNFGRVDEAFVTSDVLSEDQIRSLYCAKIAHTLGATPARGSLRVTRQRKGGAFAVGDFPAQPVRLHNFSAGSLGDSGANNTPLVNAGTAPVPMQGADGVSGNALHFGANATSHLMATDAGMPAALTPRSYGCWIKTTNAVFSGLFGWGTVSTGCAQFMVQGSGAIAIYTGGTGLNGPVVTDGQWHFVVAVEDNAAVDGAKRKLYMDGRLVAADATLVSIVLAGANKFRVGANLDGSIPYLGSIDGLFVCAQALTEEQILTLYAKGGLPLAPSPKNIGDHVEAYRANDILATFDTLDSSALIDLKVAA